MITNYHINDGVHPVNSTDEANWVRLQEPSEDEIYKIIQKFQLPHDIFIATDRPDEVARLEKIQHNSVDYCYELVVFNIDPNSSLPMEEQLQPISFIIVGNILITCANQGSDIMDNFITHYQDLITNKESFIAYSLLSIYHNFANELDNLKKVIDHLDQDARKTTKNEELFLLADTERELVYLDHTLKDLDETVNELWKTTDYVDKLNDAALLYDVRLAQRHVNKLIRLYRDLITTIGGLFSDMMSNRLNLLMKYLNSAALIISVPTLISGIWGMNNKVPGEGTEIGFWAVILFGIIMTVVSGLYLKYKDFTE